MDLKAAREIKKSVGSMLCVGGNSFYGFGWQHSTSGGVGVLHTRSSVSCCDCFGTKLHCAALSSHFSISLVPSLLALYLSLSSRCSPGQPGCHCPGYPLAVNGFLDTQRGHREAPGPCLISVQNARIQALVQPYRNLQRLISLP